MYIYRTEGNMKKLLMGLAMAGLVLLLAPQKSAMAASSKTIVDGVSIGAVDVSGMTVDEAEAAVDSYFESLQTVQLTLTGNGDNSYTFSVSDIGLSWGNREVAEKAYSVGHEGNIIKRYKNLKDIAKDGIEFEIEYSIDEALLTTILTENCDSFNIDKIDYSLTREDGVFSVVDGQVGYIIDVESSIARIEDYIQNEWNHSDASIELAIKTDEPEGNAEELMQVKDVLGTFTTSYKTSGTARSANVSNGCSLINGTTIYPGEEFSVLDTITPFTEANGYYPAGSYLNGVVVESIGGGICQVSTTFYGAVREAELEVVTRNCHSMIVTYVPASQDAAISESGGKDFQIRNNKNYPIYIEGYCDGGHAYFNIYGKEEDDPGHEVKYETEITAVNVQNTTWVADAARPLGQMATTVGGHTGVTAKLWKIVYENGQEVSRTVYNNSKYNPSNRTVVVGIASEDPNLSAAMLQAVSTQDPNTIAAAIATYAPGVSNSTPFVITPKYQVTNPGNSNSQPAAPAQPAPAPAETTVPDTTTVDTQNAPI